MEENVALDSKKQKKFVKSIKGIKKLIKNVDVEAEHKPLVLAPKDSPKAKKRQIIRKPKGLVYLSHIPHGFYEHQMTEYFKQFGGVTNVRVIRSKRTGNSRGCAFVEFREPAVAEIVAETMNNYLMGKRIIKAEVVPAEKQKRAYRKHWSSTNNPGTNTRKLNKKNFNANKDKAGDLKRARQIVANLLKTKKKLNDLGMQYDFTPVDVPEELQETVKKLKCEIEDIKDTKDIQEKPTEKSQKSKAGNKQTTNIKVVQKDKKQEKPTKAVADKEVATKVSKATTKSIVDKIPKNNATANKKMKEKGVIPLDSFIQVKSDEETSDEEVSDEGESDEEESNEEESNEEVSGDGQNGEESEDSVEEFDEEAYDKLMEKMAESSDLSFLSDEEDENTESASDESDEEPPKNPRKQIKAKGPQKQVKDKPQKQQEKPSPQQPKRKAAQKAAVASKKPKFEKKNDKKLKKKQFKAK